MATASMLGTLPHGPYTCSLPGDAGGEAWRELPGKSFTIKNASTYHTDAGSGIYLMTGDRVVFTRGPMKGMRFKRVGSATLLWLDEQGNPGRIRCARGGAAAR
ncbi:MAG: hypothetical protein KDD90_08150 [Sphingomonadaceae bacterium]|nr:hypothetical protein [Sphingomonadaceae bacterium]